MPMTLCAIAGLGGEFDTLVAYRKQYQEKLHEIPLQKPSPNWRDDIGSNESYPALFGWFSQEVAKKGIDSTVREYLPEFISSLAMEAFHPIIRLGYALDFNSEVDTAAALAYIASSHQHVPVSVDQRIELQNEMQKQVSAGPRVFSRPRFTENIRALIEADDYPNGRTTDISDCAKTALDIYRSTRNFFALHMVTATQAVRICSTYVDTNLALAALTGGLLAAHKVVGSPNFDRNDPKTFAVSPDQEHAYKYAWTCLSEYRNYEDKRYLEEILELRNRGYIPNWCAAEQV